MVDTGTLVAALSQSCQLRARYRNTTIGGALKKGKSEQKSVQKCTKLRDFFGGVVTLSDLTIKTFKEKRLIKKGSRIKNREKKKAENFRSEES